MEHTIDDLGISKRRVNFQVPAEEVTAALNTAYGRLKQNVRLHGFRPGKAPRNILEARYGQRVRADVTGDLIQKCWTEVAPSMKTVGRPSVDQQDLVAGMPFVFSITTDIVPELTAKDYLGVEVPFTAVTVPDEQVEGLIRRRLETKTSIVDVTEDRPVESGDIVITELVLKDGETELLHETGTAIRIGQERYYPGVDTELLGMRRDEEKTTRLTIGAKSELTELAGRELDATLKVVGLQAKAIPDLTDEIAAELGFEGGAEGMRLALTEQIRESTEERARNTARFALLRKIVALNTFEAPEALVNERYNMMIEEAKAMHTYMGKDPAAFAITPKTAAEYRSNAVLNVQSSFILEAIARQEAIEINTEDLDTAYQTMADDRGQTVEAIKGYFIREDAVGLLKERLLEQKTLDWLMERAKLVAPEEAAPAPTEGEAITAPVDVEPAAEAPAASTEVEELAAEE